MRVLCLCLALWGMGLSLAGCGYSSKETFPQDVRTVAAPIFANKTFYRAVEFDLGEALVKEIEQRTPYKVTAEGSADTILRGTIIDVNQRVLSSTRDGGLPQELEVRLTVSFEWRNARTGQSLRERKAFDAVGRYIPSRGVGEPFAVAQHEAVQRLAQDIVNVMRKDW